MDNLTAKNTHQPPFFVSPLMSNGDAHASTASGPDDGQSTLHQIILNLAEALRDSGDFNERAYVAVCNAARDAYTMRDDALTMLKDALDTRNQQLETLLSQHEKMITDVGLQVSRARTMLKRADQLKREAEQLAKASTPRAQLQSSVRKALPTRQLRSGRRF